MPFLDSLSLLLGRRSKKNETKWFLTFECYGSSLKNLNIKKSLALYIIKFTLKNKLEWLYPQWKLGFCFAPKPSRITRCPERKREPEKEESERLNLKVQWQDPIYKYEFDPQPSATCSGKQPLIYPGSQPAYKSDLQEAILYCYLL